MGRIPKRIVNFRLDPQLIAEVDAAAAAVGLTRTEWVASTLAMVLRREQRPAVSMAAGGHPHVVVDGCAHPRHLRRWERTGLRCTVCRTLLAVANQGA